MNKKTLVILSGGMDSTVLAYSVASQGSLIAVVSVDYGQRHRKELSCATRTAVKLGVPHHLLDLSTIGPAFLSNSALTGKADVPHGHYAEDSMKATVVPNRNMILMALAAGVAINLKADSIAYGAHAGDHAIYPDCRPEFAEAMAKAISLCDYEPPSLIRPFIDITKADIVKLGIKLGVPYEDTWTCYQGGIKACGKCGTCVERLEAFDACDYPDPLDYEDRNYWRQVIANATKGDK